MKSILKKLLIAFLLAVSLSAPQGLKAETPHSTLAELDALYDGREDINLVQQIVTNCERLLAGNSRDYELLWRCSRAYFHLGREAQSKEEKLKFYNEAVEIGKRAVEIKNDRPEGHFWLGISIGAVGETSGILKSLGSAKGVKKEMKQVIAVDDSYEEGGAYRIMGRIDHKVPWLFGGRKSRSHEYYQKALAIAPDNTYTHLFLAELLIDEGKTEEARKELEFVLGVSNNPKWAYDIRVNQAKARRLLEEIKQEELPEEDMDE
ncbi:MAG: tetratricopeptide repeat protein [Candidatus Brocadiales bacterium]